MTNIMAIMDSYTGDIFTTPMVLESGLGFPIGCWDAATATKVLMDNAPLYFAAMDNGGIEIRGNKGQWLCRTSPIVEAKCFDNGYSYFVTENGHKYKFVPIWHTIPSITPLHDAVHALEERDWSSLVVRNKVYNKYVINKNRQLPETFGELVEQAIMRVAGIPANVKRAYLKCCWVEDQFQFPSREEVAIATF